MSTDSLRRRRMAVSTTAFLAFACLWSLTRNPLLANGFGDDPETKGAETKGEAKKDDPKKVDAKDADQDDAKKGAKEPVRNPLTDGIKRFLKGNAAPAENTNGKPANAAAAPLAKKARRQGTDPRAPYDKRSDDWMRKAQDFANAGEWKSALELLQKISEFPEDMLYRTDEGRWVPLHSEAQRLRGQAPPELLDQYRVEFGGLARQLLAEARRTGDLADFGRVAATYFHTDAGYEAANRLGSLHLDRGDFALAARWFGALWQARTSVTKDPLWRAKAAYVFKQTGQIELSRELLDASLAAANPATGPSRTGSGGAGLGGQGREPGKWLGSAPKVSGEAEPALSDWPLFYGTPRRTGVATGGEPLLLPRWRLTTTDSQPVRSQIEHLLEDLADQGTTPLPMLFPTMVGGKVVFRTLHGVQVIDAATGRALWHTEESQPLERLIAGTAGQFYDDFNGGMFQGMAWGRGIRFGNNGGFFNGITGENGPLCNLLFRNANFGILSSDGRQLFVVDDPAFLTNRQPANPFGFDPGANSVAVAPSRLSSYDLETGHPLWEIGGPAYGEPFDLPLAGYFFFGAPVADGGELFVIGESTAGDSSGQIRLICLDPKNGQKKWSQLIAASEVAIEKDIGRRWWTAQVASGDGILVCPTSVGWLVAVDRATHALLWGYRPTVAGRPRNVLGRFGETEAMQMVQPTALTGAWGPAPPIIADGRVVYTPIETELLVCLDESTGKELWTKPRGNSLYLAGVFDREVVVVGRDAVTAFQLASGAQAWTTPISAPSGRGVAVADRLYLPLATGEVWSIDLKKGGVASKWNLPGHIPSIGNLAMYRGMLLSVDAFGLTAFEQRDAVQSEIARRKQQNPRDPWALLRDAEISLLARNLPAALSALRLVSSADVPPELRETWQALQVKVLTGTIRADFSSPESEANLKVLSGVVKSADDKQEFRRLSAELFVAHGEYDQAFDAYLSLAGESDDNPVFVPRDDVPGMRVRSDLWVAGRLAELREALPAAREIIDRRIAALAEKAAASDAARRKFITLFGSHPAATILRPATGRIVRPAR